MRFSKQVEWSKNDQLSKYELLKTLGRGTFGKVMLVKRKDNGKLYALKTIVKNKINDEKALMSIINEKNIL